MKLAFSPFIINAILLVSYSDLIGPGYEINLLSLTRKINVFPAFSQVWFSRKWKANQNQGGRSTINWGEIFKHFTIGAWVGGDELYSIFMHKVQDDR